MSNVPYQIQGNVIQNENSLYSHLYAAYNSSIH